MASVELSRPLLRADSAGPPPLRRGVTHAVLVLKTKAPLAVGPPRPAPTWLPAAANVGEHRNSAP